MDHTENLRNSLAGFKAGISVMIDQLKVKQEQLINDATPEERIKIRQAIQQADLHGKSMNVTELLNQIETLSKTL